MALDRRGRRWLVTLSVLAVVLAIGGWWINRQLEPQRLTAILLKKAGDALQLQLKFQGTPEYALKPEPRLLIPDFTAASSVDGKVFLSAKRAEISLPWATITGGEPVITRIELQQPVLDMSGLRRWMATLPKKPFELPTLSKGLKLSNASIHDDSYSLTGLALELPRLKTGEPAHLDARGRFRQDQTVVDFKMALEATTPGLESDFRLAGSGDLQQSPKPLHFTVQTSGHYAATDAAFSLQANLLKFDGAAPLPRIDGKAQLKLAQQMQWRFDGVLLEWPKTWPALPEPLAANTGRLPVQLSYLGKSDLSDPLSLLVSREPTVLQATLRIAEVRRWLARSDDSPIPPINGTLRTPMLKFDGIELQGVEMEVSDGAASPATAPVLPPTPRIPAAAAPQ